MKTKKRLLVVGMTLIAVGLILITSAFTKAQSNQFTIPLSDPLKRGTLKVNLNVGSITVKGSARKDVLIKYSSEANEDAEEEHEEHNRNRNAERNDADSKAGLRRIGGGGMDLEATENNNQVTIRSGSWNHHLDLDIEIPSGMDLELHTYNDGDLMVSNVQGELALSNYNGEITALNISGSVVASTYNGEIKVTLDKVTDATPMSFSTFNGDIDVTFPATLKATLKMKTQQGEIFTGFDITISDNAPVQMKDAKAGVYKVVIDDWKTGQVNGGGAEITMKNYNGDIIVRKK